MSDDVNQKSLASRALPTAYPPNTYGADRSTRYGEKFSQPIGDWRKARSAEGTYFVAHNATDDAATTLAGHAAPVLADADATMTKAFLHLRNPNGLTSLILMELDFIEIEVITAGANGTQACYSAQLDTGATRVSSGGTALTSVNPNMQSPAVPTLAILGGAVVVGVESASVRYLQHGTLRPSIEIAGDKKLFVFGGDPSADVTAAAAALRTQVVNMPPVILGPTDQFLLALHGQASQTVAGVYKVRMGWSER